MGEQETLDLFGASDDSTPPAEEEAARGRSGAATRPEAVSPTPDAADAPAEPDVPETVSVSELNQQVRRILEGAFDTLWVSGEVGNWKRARSGHCYFTLKDDAAEVRCVMWRGEASRLPMDPDDGMEVRVWADPTLYEARGSYQLRVRKLEAAGEEGLWRLAFERLRTRLQEEGLLAPERKRPLPRYPATVGVVTSTTGAALRDILSVIRRRAPWTRVLVHNARVQGDGAADEIALAVARMGARPDVDVLIVGRGGGSIEDLWAFNEEPVARAIVACAVPVVSAVGHEVDVTISDLVADLRAPTPSAAGEAVVPDGDVLRRQLGEVRLRLRRALQGAVEIRRRRLEEAPRRLAQAVLGRTRPLEHRLEIAQSRLERGIRVALESHRRRVEVLDRLERVMQLHLERGRGAVAAAAQRLDALSPLAVLKRGYAIPQDREGHVLRTAGEFRPGDAVRLRVVDGRVDLEVRDVHAEGPTSEEPTSTETKDHG